MTHGLAKISILALLLLGVVASSFAQAFIPDELPGDGIDDKQEYVGTEATNCPAGVITAGRVPAQALGGCDTLKLSADADGDGFNRVGYCTAPNCDADDSDRTIFPGSGQTVKGCTGGQNREPSASGDGTFTACAAFSCPAGYTCRFFDPSGSNTTGDGSIGNPWRDLAKISYWTQTPPYSLYTWTTPHRFYLRGGTYNFDTFLGYGSRTWACRSNLTSGTIADPNVIEAYPGEVPIIAPSSSFANGASAFYVEQCNNFTFRNLRITGGFGPSIQFQEGLNLKIQNVVATSPAANGDNHGCFFVHSTGITGVAPVASDGTVIQSSIAYDCYKSAAADSPNPSNNNNIFDFRAKGFLLRGVTSFYTAYDSTPVNGDLVGGCFLWKHANFDSSCTIQNFTMFNCGIRGIGMCGPNWTIDRVLGYQLENSVSVGDFGGPAFQTSTTGFLEVNNSTFVKTGPYNNSPQKQYNLDGSFAADMCSGNPVLATLRIRNTVNSSRLTVVDQENREFLQWVYGPDPLHDLTKLSFSNNSWHRPSGVVSFGLHEAANADTTCTGRGVLGQSYSAAQWQAAGFDTAGSGSILNVDPAFDAQFRATAVNQTDKGWLRLSEAIPTPTPTPGASAGYLPYLQ